MTTLTIPYDEPATTETVGQFLVGLTSRGWRAYTLEGERIEGCHGKTFDSVTNAVRDRWPAATLFAVMTPIAEGERI